MLKLEINIGFLQKSKLTANVGMNIYTFFCVILIIKHRLFK